MSRRHRSPYVVQWVFTARDPMGNVNSYGFSTQFEASRIAKEFRDSQSYDGVTNPQPVKLNAPFVVKRIRGFKE